MRVNRDRRVGESARRERAASGGNSLRLADSPTRRFFKAAAVFSLIAILGCTDKTPPPPRASIPPVGTYTITPEPQPKPLPSPDPALANRPPYMDEPLVAQPPPEQQAFVDTYERVGRPRMTLFVNRTLNGQIVPTTTGGVTGGTQRIREATGAVKADVSAEQRDYWGRPYGTQSDKFETTGPATLTDRTETYLAPGEYDELSARRVDYDAIENVLSDWLAANGRVSLISPKLSEGQILALQQGKPSALADLSQNNQIDVLVQVQAKATRQTPQGLSVRLIGEAINTRGGESLGRAFVDVPPPLEKTTINDYTRFLARKLMSDMTQTWQAPRPPAANAVPSTEVPPATQP